MDGPVNQPSTSTQPSNNTPSTDSKGVSQHEQSRGVERTDGRSGSKSAFHEDYMKALFDDKKSDPNPLKDGEEPNSAQGSQGEVPGDQPGTQEGEQAPVSDGSYSGVIKEFDSGLATSKPELYAQLQERMETLRAEGLLSDNISTPSEAILNVGTDLVLNALDAPKEQRAHALASYASLIARDSTREEVIQMLGDTVRALGLGAAIDAAGINFADIESYATALAKMHRTVEAQFKEEYDKKSSDLATDYELKEFNSKFNNACQPLVKDVNSYPMFGELLPQIEDFVMRAGLQKFNSDPAGVVKWAYSSAISLNPEIKARVDAARMKNTSGKVNKGVSEVPNSAMKPNTTFHQDFIDALK